MADLTYQDVLSILRLIDTAGFAELEVEFEGTRIKVARKVGQPVPSRQADASATPTVPSASRRPDAAPVEAAVGPHAAAPDAELRPGDVAVTPPMEGTFYAAPAPGAPPFAAVGRRVRRGDQLGTVEVMKLFTPVASPCDGTVRAILVANEEVVAKDAILMIVSAEGEQGQ